MESYIIQWFGLMMILGFVVIALRNKQKTKRIISEPKPVSVIVPFRNEKAFLKEAIDSLLREVYIAGDEFIFINDHSDDGSELIDELKNPLITMLHLEGHERGKKAALSKGLNRAKNEWVITLDADCRVSKGYLNEMRISMNEDADMLLARVYPDRGEDSLLLIIEQYEYFLLSVLSHVSALIRLPLLASGAALAFRKNAWNKNGRYLTNVHSASGDDMYLLRDFYLNKCKIKPVLSRNAFVFTTASPTVNEWLQQKLRWAGKSGMYPDLSRKLLAFFFLIHLFIPVLALFINWQIAVYLPFFEMFFFVHFSELPDKKMNRSILYGFLLRFIYPVLVVYMFFASRRKVMWKGRPV
ncbi:MAG: glycosyltransferase [Bacteroidia bacterium]